MRDIIENARTSSEESLPRRYSTDSTRTANDGSGQNSDYGNEKGELSEKVLPPPPVVPVGFWDHSLAKTRRDVLKGWLKISQYLSRRRGV